MKLFEVHLYSLEYPTIYDDYIVKAKDAAAAEDAFELMTWGSQYECFAEDISIFYDSLCIEATEVSVEELLSEGYSLKEIEEVEEV